MRAIWGPELFFSRSCQWINNDHVLESRGHYSKNLKMLSRQHTVKTRRMNPIRCFEISCSRLLVHVNTPWTSGQWVLSRVQNCFVHVHDSKHTMIMFLGDNGYRWYTWKKSASRWMFWEDMKVRTINYTTWPLISQIWPFILAFIQRFMNYFWSMQAWNKVRSSRASKSPPQNMTNLTKPNQALVRSKNEDNTAPLDTPNHLTGEKRK